MSAPMVKIPVRNSELDTIWPRPVRSRLARAAAMPATVVMAVMWSPEPPGV